GPRVVQQQLVRRLIDHVVEPGLQVVALRQQLEAERGVLRLELLEGLTDARCAALLRLCAARIRQNGAGQGSDGCEAAPSLHHEISLHCGRLEACAYATGPRSSRAEALIGNV